MRITPENLKTDVKGFVEYVETKEGGFTRPMSMGKNTIVIAGFPGVGKTYEFKKYAGTNTIYVDSDSSKFHWIIENGEKTTDPRWPKNYEQDIISKIGTVDYLCVSTHRETIDILKRLKIPYILVYPESNLKNEYIERYKKRGSDEGFINFIDKNWDYFLNDMRAASPFLSKVLKSGQYLGDALFSIEWDTLEELKNRWYKWQEWITNQ